MSQRWAVRVERTEVDSVQKLRLAEGAEICELAEDVWVRGEKLDEPLARLLRRHPHARRHWVLADNQLVSPGKRVPRGYLPEGPWTPLREWLRVRLPDAFSAARLDRRVPVQLVRSAEERPANVLLTDLAGWLAYGSQAPQVRLACWHFAAAADRRVVVRGLPLPPLPGERYAEQDGVAAPAGWNWLPAVEPAVLREVLGLQPHDLALLQEDGTWERIGAEQFVRATRAAICETARGFGHD
jgi:hypothetical protein